MSLEPPSPHVIWGDWTPMDIFVKGSVQGSLWLLRPNNHRKSSCLFCFWFLSGLENRRPKEFRKLYDTVSIDQQEVISKRRRKKLLFWEFKIDLCIYGRSTKKDRRESRPLLLHSRLIPLHSSSLHREDQYNKFLYSDTNWTVKRKDDRPYIYTTVLVLVGETWSFGGWVGTWLVET